MKASVLSKKQVISTRSGEMIGKIVDFEFDPQQYRIEAVCIEKRRSSLFGWLFLWFSEPRIVMDVNRILSIGTDVVLVEAPPTEKKRDNR